MQRVMVLAFLMLISGHASAVAFSDYLQQAHLKYAQTDYEEALSYYQSAQALRPDEPVSLQGQASTLYLLGRKHQALEAFKRLQMEKPSDKDLAKIVARIEAELANPLSTLVGTTQETRQLMARTFQQPHEAVLLDAGKAIAIGRDGVEAGISVGYSAVRMAKFNAALPEHGSSPFYSHQSIATTEFKGGLRADARLGYRFVSGLGFDASAGMLVPNTAVYKEDDDFKPHTIFVPEMKAVTSLHQESRFDATLVPVMAHVSYLYRVSPGFGMHGNLGVGYAWGVIKAAYSQTWKGPDFERTQRAFARMENQDFVQETSLGLEWLSGRFSFLFDVGYCFADLGPLKVVDQNSTPLKPGVNMTNEAGETINMDFSGTLAKIGVCYQF
jgi:hypothetical protein